MSEFCGACGGPLKSGAKFCAACGYPADESQPSQGKVAVRGSRGGGWGKLAAILLGLLLAGYGLSTQVLAFLGENKEGTVTSVESRTRQIKDSQGKSTGRTERYYSVKYGFKASDGSIQSGSYEVPQTSTPPRVGSSVYVRYLAMYPSLNAKADDVGLWLGGLAMLGVGLVILFFGSTR